MLNNREATAALAKLKYHPEPGEDPAAVRKECREEQARIRNEFRAFLEHEYAYDLPPRMYEPLWTRAWDQGHSYGYNAVEVEYEDLVAFLRECM